MEKSLPVKTAKAPARQTSPFALFIAQYAYLQRFHATGFVVRSSITIADCDWSVIIGEDSITVNYRPDVSLSQVRSEQWSKLNAEIGRNEVEAENVRDALKKLQTSIEQVEGKRSLLSKIDEAKQPDIYAAEKKKLNELESFLGDYQPFLDQYNALIESCEQKIKYAKDSLDALPTIRESQTYEFPLSEIAEVIK
jgi:chromosome segregation ATPase